MPQLRDLPGYRGRLKITDPKAAKDTLATINTIAAALALLPPKAA